MIMACWIGLREIASDRGFWLRVTPPESWEPQEAGKQSHWTHPSLLTKHFRAMWSKYNFLLTNGQHLAIGYHLGKGCAKNFTKHSVIGWVLNAVGWCMGAWSLACFWMNQVFDHRRAFGDGVLYPTHLYTQIL